MSTWFVETFFIKILRYTALTDAIMASEEKKKGGGKKGKSKAVTMSLADFQSNSWADEVESKSGVKAYIPPRLKERGREPAKEEC